MKFSAFTVAGATTAALKHLRKEHRVENPSKKRRTADRDSCDEHDLPSSSIETWFLSKNIARGAFDKDVFSALLYRWIITDDIAFLKVESAELRALLEYCLPMAAASLPSRKIVGRNIKALHKQSLVTVIEALRSALSKISFSFDLWTSPNNRSMLGVVSHFVDAGGKVRSVRLALQRQYGQHSGANIAQSLRGLLTKFNIMDKVGYFVCDNASNNDTCIESLLPHLPECYADKRQIRLRCAGHIFNLVATAIMFGHDIEAREELFDEYAGDVDAALLEWRSRGPVGKLHNVVRYIRASPQRIAEFEHLQHVIASSSNGAEHSVKSLVLDVATRWNSVSSMIDRAIQLRLAIDNYSSKVIGEWHQHKKKDQPTPSLVHDALTTDDWSYLEEYREILTPLQVATDTLQGHAGGNFGAIWLVLPTIESLLDILEEKKLKCQAEINSQVALSQLEPSYDDKNKFWSHLATSVNRGWIKLDDYYTRLDDTPVYVAAMVLHPFFKWDYCETHWSSKSDKGSWTEAAKKSVDRLWQTYRKSKAAAQPRVDNAIVIQQKLESNLFNFSAMRSHRHVDQMASYLAETPSSDLGFQQSPVSYWLSKRTTWPELSAMALDIFAVPAMSDEPERLFSNAGNTLSPRRRMMQDDTTESLMIMKSWLQQDVVSITKDEMRRLNSMTSAVLSIPRSPSVG